MLEKLICPHCLYKFESEDYIFRASHSINVSEDEKLMYFREKYLNRPTEPLPIVLTDDNIKARIEINGVITEVSDKYNYYTRNRICPECHNSLPKSAGIQKIFIIPVFGSKNSGKSSFIASLVHKLTTGLGFDMSNGCFLHSDIDSVIKYQLQYEKPLYIGGYVPTLDLNDSLSPVIIEYRKKNNKKNTLSSDSTIFYIYDINIENLSNPINLKIYEKVFINASAVIYITDMVDIFSYGNDINENDSEKLQDEIKWNSTFSDTFVDLLENRKINVPVSVVMTKSDMTKSDKIEHIKDEIEVYKNEFFHKNNIDLLFVRKISNKLRKTLLSLSSEYVDGLDKHFNNYKFFTVSCYKTNKNIIDRSSLHENNTDMPFLWLLYKLRIVKGSYFVQLKRRINFRGAIYGKGVFKKNISD